MAPSCRHSPLHAARYIPFGTGIRCTQWLEREAETPLHLVAYRYAPLRTVTQDELGLSLGNVSLSSFGASQLSGLRSDGSPDESDSLAGARATLSVSFWFTSVVLLLLWLKDGVALALAWVDLGGERDRKSVV